MQPYMPMPPAPPPKGSNTGLIVGLVVGLLVLLVVGMFVCAGVWGYMRAKRAARMASYSSYSSPYTSPYSTSTSTTTTTGLPTLSESYSTSNGLVTAHYPSDFAAKALDHATLMLSKNNSDGSDEVVELAGVEHPISNDVNEFSRILINMMKKNIEATGDRWTETARRRTTCFKTYPGLEVEGTFTARGITKENVKICYFMRPGKGYELKTIVPDLRESTDYPTLRSIVDATEIK